MKTWQQWAADTCPDEDYKQMLMEIDMKSRTVREKNREYQSAFKQRKRDAGLVPVEIWIQPDRKPILENFAAVLRDLKEIK